MKKKKGLKVLIIVLILLAVLGSGAAIAWNSPLLGRRLPKLGSALQGELKPAEPSADPQAADPDQLPLPTSIPLEGLSEAELEQIMPTVEAAQTQAALAEGGPVCGGPEVMHVLVLGIDENEQSDAIRLVRIDYVQQSVHVVGIPRDFYGPIVGFEDQGIREGRINATYGYGEYYTGRGSGVVSIANNIQHNFGITFDNYLVLHLYNVDTYIDKLGGIDIILEKAASDPGHYYGVGEHHFTGEQAVEFMRIRYYDTDFARINRQTMILKAAYKKAMAEMNLVQLMGLALQVLQDRTVSTDFAAKDIYPLVCLAKGVSGDKVHFIEIPRDMHHGFTTSAGGAVQIWHDSVPGFLQSVMNGTYQP